MILADFLAEVLRYDKYSDVTTELAVRSTFCDLAITTGNRVQFLIEVKSIGTELRDNHLPQATAYAAHQGVDWVLLTNGVVWQAHRMKFEQPISADRAFEIDLLDPAANVSDLLLKLYLILREAIGGSAIDARLSGPLADRIDLHITVRSVPAELLARMERAESSAAIRARVMAARERQRMRFAAMPDVSCNGRAPARWLLRDGGADGAVMRELARMSESSPLSARGFDRVLRVARTIADLAARDCVTIDDVREAMRYRGEARVP